MSKITEATEIFVPKYHVLQELLGKHERSHWIEDEADMAQDVTQWKDGTITPKRKEFVKMILRLFTQADTDVCSGYVEKLLPVFKQADARMMLLSFASREVTHIKAYKRLNDTLGYDTEAFMSEFLQYKEMADKHTFFIEQSNMRSNKGVAEYLAKQILLEGVSLFASFAMLLNFSRQGQLSGLVSINQWSIIDEQIHVQGLSELFKIFVAENPSVVNEEFKKTIYETARTVVKLEDDFIDLCYNIEDNEKLSKKDLKDYIRFVCDIRMQQMGFKPQFNVEKNPLPFIEEITGDGVFGNFFESTITAYSKQSLVGEWEY
jgi:ribonucleoside-diphosphate reductase beta chain